MRGLGAPRLPAPRPGQPGARLPSRVSLRATRGRCGPPAARGAAWSRLGAEGRPRGGRREERGTSASRSLTGRCWRPRRKRRESAARGPHSPAPLRPTRPGPWTPGAGLGERRAHVTEPPGHVTAAAGHGGAGWGPSCWAAGPRGPEPAGREARRGLVFLARVRECRAEELGTLALPDPGRRGGRRGRRLWPKRPASAGGNRGNLCGQRGGSAPGEGGSPAWPAPPPVPPAPGEREALCPGWAAAEGGGETPGPSPV